MGAISDLLKSERGILAVLLVIISGVLAHLGRIPAQDWTDYSKWIFVTYTAGKTVTGAMQIAKGGTADPESPTPAAAAPPLGVPAS